MTPPPSRSVAIIGAGPAGLTAAYLLSREGVGVTVLERDPKYVGGISRTVEYKGFRFDIGGHRFFSKSREVEDLWTELLGDDLLHRPRSSRIYYGGKFYSYPLKAGEALRNLGIFESARCVASYAWARLFPVNDPRSFEDWVSNQFGRRLFGIFFKTYTEKVWGMSCKEISADWAAQRIKGLSLSSAILAAILPRRKNADRSATIKTLIDSFRYPRLGPGMMWEAAAERTRAHGGSIVMGARVTELERLPDGRWRVGYERQGDGARADAAGSAGNGGVVEADIRTELFQPVTLGPGPARSGVARWAVDCAGKRLAVLSMTVYSHNNLTGELARKPPSPPTWQAPVESELVTISVICGAARSGKGYTPKPLGPASPS